jgi:hypothetical protein
MMPASASPSPQAPAAMGGRAEYSWLHSGHLEPGAQMGKKASQWHSGNSTKLLVLILWRCKLGLCLNYLLQSPAWFTGNLNHLGAGAFELISRWLPFERVAAAGHQTVFDMGRGFHGGCKACIAHRISLGLAASVRTGEGTSVPWGSFLQCHD